MNSATHQFVLRVPFELWLRLEKFCARRGITVFVLEAIREKLDREQE